MAEILKDVCFANGCVWVAMKGRSERPDSRQMLQKGTLYCALDVDPDVVLSKEGCVAATREGPFDFTHGDLRFGVMRANGFTSNSEPTQTPPGHPLRAGVRTTPAGS